MDGEDDVGFGGGGGVEEYGGSVEMSGGSGGGGSDGAMIEQNMMDTGMTAEPAIESANAGEQDLAIQRECLDLFASTDYIMEPTIFDTIKTYFMHGGEPGPVVDLLSDNYVMLQNINIINNKKQLYDKKLSFI